MKRIIILFGILFLTLITVKPAEYQKTGDLFTVKVGDDIGAGETSFFSSFFSSEIRDKNDILLRINIK